VKEAVSLPRRFGYAGYLAIEGEFPEGETRQAIPAKVSPWATRDVTAVPNTYARRVPRHFAKLALGLVELFVGRLWVGEDRFELSPLGTESLGDAATFFVTRDR